MCHQPGQRAWWWARCREDRAAQPPRASTRGLWRRGGWRSSAASWRTGSCAGSCCVRTSSTSTKTRKKPNRRFQPRSHTTENSQRVAKLKAGALLFGRRDYIYIIRCSFLLEDGTAESCSSNIWSLMCSWIHEKPSCKWFDLKLLFSLSVWVREGEKTNLGLSNQSMSSSRGRANCPLIKETLVDP